MLAVSAPIPAHITSYPFQPLQTFTKLNHFVPSNDPILQQLAKENTCWERLKAKFQPNTKLYNQIVSLSSKSQYDKSDIPQIASAFSSSDFYRLRSSLRTMLIKLPTLQRRELFNLLCEAPKFQALKNCLTLIPFEELKLDLNAATENIDLMIQCMAKCEVQLRKRAASEEQMLHKSVFSYLGQLFHGLMDTLMMAFSFFEIGKEPGTSWDASYLLSTYGKILAAPLTIFTALTTIFPIVQAILFTVAIVVAIILFIMIYVKWLKPCFENMELFVNLTKMAKEGRLEPVVGRDDQIESLIQCLASSSKNSRSHPFLIGPPGVGKSEIVKGLALRIAQGKVPDCLKNKKVFMVDTSKLVSSDRHDSVNRIQRLLIRLREHKEEIIIFFDEFHAAFSTETAQAKLGDSLNNVFDTNPDGLLYAIAATTRENYDTYIRTNESIKRRFVEIDVKATEEDKTLWILREIVLRQAPDLLIKDKDLQAIYDKTKKNKVEEPAIAVRVLSKVISNMRLEQSGYHAFDQLQILRTQFAARMAAYRMSQDPKILSELIDLEKQIEPIEKARTNEKDQLKILTDLQHFLAQQKESAFKLAHSIFYKEDSKQTEEAKKMILMIQKFLEPNVEDKVQQIATTLQHTSVAKLIKQEIPLIQKKRRKSF